MLRHSVFVLVKTFPALALADGSGDRAIDLRAPKAPEELQRTNLHTLKTLVE